MMPIVGLPFTPDQFFELFAQYNRSFWFVAAALWLATSLTLIALRQNRARWSRPLTYLLGAAWMWNAVAYHAFLFTRINPAAWLFAGIFALEAALLVHAARRGSIEHFSSAGPMRVVGIGLVCYAMGYPILNITLGHAYPATPTFGVPCPTAILTIGLLLAAHRTVPLTLAVIPALWGFIGGSAALVLDVWPDYVLLAGGVLLTAVLLRRAIRRRGPPR